MTFRVLVTAPYFIPVLDKFRPTFEANGITTLVPDVEERMSEDQLLKVVHDIDGTICGDDAYTDRVLERAPRLRVISKWGTGIDSIDSTACRRRGVTVCNTPNAFTMPVADSAVGYLLEFVRRLREQTELMRAGQWYKLPLRSLSECTVGIVGLGDIGREVAKRLSAFGPRILGTDPRRPPEEFVRTVGMEMVGFETLLGESDFVTLHCDLNPTSDHLMNRSALARMRPGSFLINTARGRLVEEPALIDALRSGALGGAALDVFENEPLALDSPLRKMPNVFLASHNSNSSPRAWEHVHARTVENLLKCLLGKP
jgi:D-3-phosphoglycerate dehydrogenase